MSVANNFCDVPLPKYLDLKTVLIYRPHPVRSKTYKLQYKQKHFWKIRKNSKQSERFFVLLKSKKFCLFRFSLWSENNLRILCEKKRKNGFVHFAQALEKEAKRNPFRFEAKMFKKRNRRPPFFAIFFSQVRFAQSIIVLFEDFNYPPPPRGCCLKNWLTAPEWAPGGKACAAERVASVAVGGGGGEVLLHHHTPARGRRNNLNRGVISSR